MSKNNKLYVSRFVPYAEIKRSHNVFLAKAISLCVVLCVLVGMSAVYAAKLLPKDFGAKHKVEKAQTPEPDLGFVYPQPDEDTRVKADRLKAIIYEDWSEHNYAPNVAELDNVYINDSQKICYLTFDDGPSKITPQILEVLKGYDVKATFFVTGVQTKKYPDVIKKIHKDGHTIGNHSYSHVYNTVYDSKEAFEDELLACKKEIDSALGKEYKNLVFRFPGGFTSLQNEQTKAKYIDVLQNLGYKYIDWSCLTGDSNTTEPTFEYLMDTLRYSIGNSKTGDIVVLMHDSTTKQITADTLGQIVEYIASLGYQFKPLKN